MKLLQEVSIHCNSTGSHPQPLSKLIFGPSTRFSPSDRAMASAMPSKRGSKASKQTAIAFYPTLNKPATAVGKYISAPGKFWNGCPAADKEKRFKCAVVEFSALHDYGDGVKGAGFSCKEMGEDGRGSLEPGVASGSEFMIGYPNPFLEYY